MTETQSRNTRIATADLDSALESIEQQCQTLRWRLINFDDDQSSGQLDSDLGILTNLACHVSRLYGRLEGLADSVNAADDAPPPTEPDADETTDPMSATELAESSLEMTTYNVIQFFGDTEIVEVLGENGDYPTFEAATSEAIDHLEDVTELCELTIDFLRIADTPELYFGTKLSTVPKADGNVRYVCKDAYTLDPEIQAKPLPWFVGKLVKLDFSIPARPDNGELMWVAVNSIRGEELVGTLANEPLYAVQACGDEIVFRREDVLVVRESRVTV